MAARRRSTPEPQGSRRRPATTPEGRETQMVSLAVELAEKQLRDGTASAQVISHYLKLGSSRERLEQQRLQYENQLTQVKIEALESQKHIEELYKEALNAMSAYSGREPMDPQDEYDG